uniref:rRNA adenine N(6)-methyltransferase n=1 Tax=Panagrolaimus sp. ES5 TaxID=591445 RepID=A0AC34FQB2_9BILA
MALKVLQSSLIRQIKSSGASVGKLELQTEVIKWIQSCSSSASTSSSNQINDLNVILFDSHSDSLAKELLERNVKNLLLLEGSRINADKQKEATETLEEQYPNSNISALHVSMKDILSPSKSVKINGPLWQRFQDISKPQIKYKNYPLPKKEQNQLVMFGCLPFPTQQRALLSSLLQQLLIYYDSSSSKATKIKHANSYFQFGTFSLITFLHARFEPEIPLTPIKAYFKHLEKLGFEENKLYPVKIEPRPLIQLPGNIEILFKFNELQKDENKEEIQRRKQIIKYAYWMLMAGKNPKQLKDTWEAFDLSTNDEISPPKTVSEFSSCFPKVAEKLQNKFSTELNSFRSGLYKNKTDEKVAD